MSIVVFQVVNQHFGGKYRIHLHGVEFTLHIEVIRSSETSLTTYKNTRRHNQKYFNRYIRCRENLEL
jgi:hypothetical protein